MCRIMGGKVDDTMITQWFKTTQSVRGWTAADMCTNCVNFSQPTEIGAQFRFVLCKHNSPEKRGMSSQIQALMHTTRNRTSSQYKKQNSYRNLEHQKYLNTPPYAQTGNTNRQALLVNQHLHACLEVSFHTLK